MQVPLEIVFKKVNRTPQIDQLISDKAAKLERACDHLSSCRIAIEKPQEHQQRGNPYRVRIEMTVPPGHDLVVAEESSKGDMHDPLSVVIKKAFSSAERRLKKLVDLQQYEVKTHPHQQVMGIVKTLMPDRGYGFIQEIDTGSEIYFHKNSVLHNGFERMQVGTGVRFVTEEGDKGPQASTVEVMFKSGAGVRPLTENPDELTH